MWPGAFRIAPISQKATQAWHPTQAALLSVTTPDLSLLRASAGHRSTHRPHWSQTVHSNVPSLPSVIRNADFSPPSSDRKYCTFEQARSQARSPLHRSRGAR